MINYCLKFCIVCGLCLCYSLNFAQGYRIDIDLGESKRDGLFLGYYLNGKTYVKDSATVLENGKYAFQGPEQLPRGMYFLADGTTLLFDFVVGTDQNFKMILAEEEFSEVRVEGDEDNRLFFENMRFNLERQKEGAPFIQTLRDSTSSIQEKGQAEREVGRINRQVAAYQNEIIEQYPQSILATLFKSGKQVEMPEEIANATDQGSERRKLYYYRNHYWDFFDLDDPVLMRLPRSFYKEKVDDFLDNLVLPSQDSIIVAVDELIAQSKKEEETYQYLVWHLTTKYQSSKIMGMDEVYVHLVDTYFETGEMDFWANEQLKKNLPVSKQSYRNGSSKSCLTRLSGKTPSLARSFQRLYRHLFLRS